VHGQKHKFEALESERDSWLAAVKKVTEEAKAKKEEIIHSEGYKEALAKLSMYNLPSDCITQGLFGTTRPLTRTFPG
jgi:hypothetical protein